MLCREWLDSFERARPSGVIAGPRDPRQTLTLELTRAPPGVVGVRDGLGQTPADTAGGEIFAVSMRKCKKWRSAWVEPRYRPA